MPRPRKALAAEGMAFQVSQVSQPVTLHAPLPRPGAPRTHETLPSPRPGSSAQSPNPAMHTPPTPPTTPRNKTTPYRGGRWPTSSGRTMLPPTPAPPPQITTTTKPFPQCPLNPRYRAPGTQISAEPTTGTSEKNAINTAQKIGVEIPPIVNASPPRTPCKPAITRATATLAKIKSPDSRSISS